MSTCMHAKGLLESDPLWCHVAVRVENILYELLRQFPL